MDRVLRLGPWRLSGVYRAVWEEFHRAAPEPMTKRQIRGELGLLPFELDPIIKTLHAARLISFVGGSRSLRFVACVPEGAEEPPRREVWGHPGLYAGIPAFLECVA